MKKIVILIIPFLAFTKIATYSVKDFAPNDSATLIIMQGESNASGMADNATAPSSQVNTRTEVQIQQMGSGLQFTNLNIKASASGGNNQLPTAVSAVFGMELALANQVDSGYFQAPVYLAKFAQGGTKIGDWMPSGTSYTNYIHFLDSAVNQMNRLHTPFRIWVWQSIGINDQGGGTLVDSFVARMAQLRSILRTRYSRPDIKFLVTDFSNPSFGGGYTFPWQTQIDNMATTDAGGTWAISCDKTTYNAGQSPVHWDLAGLGTVAHNMVSRMVSQNAANALSNGTPLTFTSKAQDTLGPGRGWQRWMNHVWDNSNGNGVNIGGGQNSAYDYYYRFAWWEIETNTQGVYNWSNFDGKIHTAMDNRQKFNFGVMPIFIGGSIVGGVAGLTYPTYLHTLEQADAVKDWQSSATSNYWVHNWNGTPFLTRAKALLMAIKAHIDSNSYTPSWSGSPVPLSNAIGYVDIRMFGNFGEWHNCCYLNSTPAGAKATQQTLDSIIQFHVDAFPNYPLLAMIAAFDQGNPTSTGQPAEVGYRALTQSNNWGQFGWRRDAWGEPGGDNTLSNNPYSYNGTAFQPLIMNKYQFSYVGGEPSNNTGNTTVGGTIQGDLAREVSLYHVNFIGNENFGTNNSGTQTNVRANSVTMGYNIKLVGGSMTTTLSPSGSFNVSIQWRNDGITPTYENWVVKLQLRDHTTQSVIQTFTSTFNPKPLAPGSTLTENDNFTLGAVSAGTADLYLTAVDASGYRLPLPLMITGRGADGYYPVRTGISITGSSAIPPVAQAGGPFSIVLPINTVTADGSHSFANGSASISSYAWTTISGPGTQTIVNPTSAITVINNLIAGTYNFQLQVTDNNGMTGLDTLVVVVANSTTTTGLNVFSTQTPSGTSGTLTAFTNQTPSGSLFNDGQGLNLGMKFRSTVNTTVTGVRFYKQSGNNGTHQGFLYSSAGATLASGTFTGETSSGWQTLIFGSPVSITANTTYIVSYFTPNGTYSDNNGYMSSAVTNSTLSILADGTDGHNGVFLYNATAAFPSNSNTNKPNYWIDPIVSYNSSLVNDGTGVNLGMRFSSSIDALVTGVRFYKVQGNNGTHVGELYSSTGVRLASATFTSETSTGWQTAAFDQPILIQPGLTYLVSYFSPNGTYTIDTNYFTAPVVNNTLTAPAGTGISATDNGQYFYSSSPGFPNAGGGKVNYWIDVIVAPNTCTTCAGQYFYNINFNKVKN